MTINGVCWPKIIPDFNLVHGWYWIKGKDNYHGYPFFNHPLPAQLY